MAPKASLWRCPICSECFTTRNQWHSCGRFDLEKLFAGKEPRVRALYERFPEIVEKCGPVTVIPQKSRIAFQARMRFAALMPQKSCLKGHLVLAERHDAPGFENVESYSSRNHPARVPARVREVSHAGPRAFREGGVPGGRAAPPRGLSLTPR